MTELRPSTSVDIVFIKPWGNMCDYYQLLSANIEFSSTLIKLKPSLPVLSNAISLDRQKIDELISYQIMRRKGKLSRGFPFARQALAFHRMLYRYQFTALLNCAYPQFVKLKPKCVCVWNGHRLREKAAIAAAEEAQRLAAVAAKDTVKGMRTVTRYEVTDHRALLHWIARNDKDAIRAFVDEYARKEHKAIANADGIRVWQEKEAF
jgi:hypothetical protein